MSSRVQPSILLSRFLFLLAATSGCGKSEEQLRADVTAEVKAQLLADIGALKTAAVELQANAPTEVWTPSDVASMRAAWKSARVAYERAEGAIAPIFPDIDAAIDERYDGFLEAGADRDLFDGVGVTGMHGVERILFADITPAAVIAAESVLPGYVAAAFPATDAEAADFKVKLLAKLVRDTTTLETAWAGAELDLPAAYQGLIDLMLEQREKVNNASAGFEESRYSQVTMTDLRNNYDGTKEAWERFAPWVATKEGGPALIAEVNRGFATLATAYAAVPGEAIPPPPETWSAESPSASDLTTPFGVLYVTVREATDELTQSSIVSGMATAGEKLGLVSP